MTIGTALVVCVGIGCGFLLLLPFAIIGAIALIDHIDESKRVDRRKRAKQ